MGYNMTQFKATKAIRSALRARGVQHIWTNKKANTALRNIKCWAPNDQVRRDTLIKDVTRDMVEAGVSIIAIRQYNAKPLTRQSASIIFDVAI